jgi:hypothetical protein
MLLSAYTASSTMELLRSLTSSNSSSSRSDRFDRQSADPFAGMFGGTAMSESNPASGLDMFPQISSATINALLAAQSPPLTGSLPSIGSLPSAATGMPDVPKDLFSELDADGDGKVTRSEFEANAAGAATSSYKVMNEMIARQMQAFASSSTAWMKF